MKGFRGTLVSDARMHERIDKHELKIRLIWEGFYIILNLPLCVKTHNNT